jgi:hypothetical protein
MTNVQLYFRHCQRLDIVCELLNKYRKPGLVSPGFYLLTSVLLLLYNRRTLLLNSLAQFYRNPPYR